MGFFTSGNYCQKHVFVSGRRDITSQSQFRYTIWLMWMLLYVEYIFVKVLTTLTKKCSEQIWILVFFSWKTYSKRAGLKKILQWIESNKKLTVLTETISTINLNKPCETQSLNLALGRQPKLFPSISENSSLTPDSVKCSPSPTLRLNRTLKYTKSYNIVVLYCLVWIKYPNSNMHFMNKLTDTYGLDDFAWLGKLSLT